MCSEGAMKSTGETPPMPARPDDAKEVRSDEKRSVSPQSRSRRTAGDGAIAGDEDEAASGIGIGFGEDGGALRSAPAGSFRRPATLSTPMASGVR